MTEMLSQIDRLVVQTYNAGLKGREIAARCGLPEGTLATRLYSLRQRGLIGRRNTRRQPEALSPSEQLARDLAKYHRQQADKAAKLQARLAAEKTLIDLYLLGAARKTMAAKLEVCVSRVEARLRRLRREGLIPVQQPKAPAPAPAAAPARGAAGDAYVSPNAWPGGPRRMTCWCGNSFISEGKQNRRCVPCRSSDEGPDLAPAISFRGFAAGSRSWVAK